MERWIEKQTMIDKQLEGVGRKKKVHKIVGSKEGKGW